MYQSNNRHHTDAINLYDKLICHRKVVFPACEIKISQVLQLYKSHDPMFFNNPYFRFSQKYLKSPKTYRFHWETSPYLAVQIRLSKIWINIHGIGYVTGENYWSFRQFRLCHMYFHRSYKGIWYCRTQYFIKRIISLWDQGQCSSMVYSYLSNRYKYVNYNNTSSDLKLITCGVPQWYDDTTLFYSSQNLQELHKHGVNTEWIKLIGWL